jgi:integrase
MTIIRASEIDQRIRAAKALGRAAEHRLESARGLWLRISGSGVASWSLVYRTRSSSKLCRWKIGRLNEIGAAEASERARRLLGQIDNGFDPKAGKEALAKENRRRAEAITVRQAVDAFLMAKADKRSIGNMRAMLMNSLVARHGDMLLEDVTADHVTNIHDAIAAAGKLRAADNTFSTIRSCLSYCHKKRKWLARNVACGISLKQGSKDGKRHRTLSAEEIRIFWRELNHGTEGRSWQMGAIMRLALLLGQRANEVAGLRRDELDIEANGSSIVWIIPASRMKPGRAQVLRLPPLARKIVIDAMRRENGPVLFPARSGQPFRTTSIAHAMSRLQAQLSFRGKDGRPDPIKMHDLRRTLATGRACPAAFA